MKKVIRYLGYILFLPFWYLQRLIPRKKNRLIFGAWNGEKYSDNSKYLFEYMLREHREYTCVWITKNRTVYEKLRREHKPAAIAGSVRGIYYCLTARYAFIGSGLLDFNQFCLNGIKQVWLWHGMPLKRIGHDDILRGNGGVKKRIIKALGIWTNKPYKTVTSAAFFLPFLSSAFQLDEKDIVRTGLPRCDGLFAARPEALVEKIREAYRDCKILLYMPTFRTAAWTGVVFNPFDGYGFDAARFSDTLEKTNTVFLYKPHFCDAGLSVAINTARFIQIGDDDYDDLYNLLAQVDMLMTDYSSVYFDFIATRKPVILAPFDYDDYIKNSREHYFDYWKEMEGAKAGDWEEVLEILTMQKYYAVSETAVKKFAEFNDGKSCEKVFKAVLRDR